MATKNPRQRMEGYRMPKMPKLDTRAPIDPTRTLVSNAAPADKSIYSNPVTNLNELRTPTTDPGAYGPNGRPLNRSV